MTSDELVERVARALFDQAFDALLLGALRYDDLDAEDRALWQTRARAALVAVRQAAGLSNEGSIAAFQLENVADDLEEMDYDDPDCEACRDAAALLRALAEVRADV